MNQSKSRREYDAVVVGSGPNGLAAAIHLQRRGLSVLIIEGKDEIGGGLRTAELTLPGFHHDICSAIHPLAVSASYFQQLPLAEQGLEFVHPLVAAAHPLDDGTAAVLHHSLDDTARLLGKDEKLYRKLIEPVTRDWKKITADVLGPLRVPSYPRATTSFGWKAIRSATSLAHQFTTDHGRALWAGMAAHAILPLTKMTTSAIALILLGAGHTGGWPIARGGSVSIAHALERYFLQLGGSIEKGLMVRSLDQLPSSRAVLFDITPHQLLQIAGHRLSSLYKWQLSRYRQGMGVFKIDWALDAPVPFTAEECRLAGTVHLGNTFEEIRDNEENAWRGQHPDQPFVLFAQQSLFDMSRAPHGKHTAWAYCHVPNGSTKDMTEAIEKQVERFAPGFREQILARHVFTTQYLEQYNPNYVGGDINGGMMDLAQIFTRPALRLSPYKTSAKGLYLCSSSTPPGGGVHGWCGYHAAEKVIKDLFPHAK